MKKLYERLLARTWNLPAYVKGVGEALAGRNYDAGWSDAEDFAAAGVESPEDDGWEKYQEDEIAPMLESGEWEIADDSGEVMVGVYVTDEEDDYGNEYKAATFTTYNEDGEVCCERAMDGATAFRFAYAGMEAARLTYGAEPYRLVPREVLVTGIEDYVRVMFSEGAKDGQ